MARSQTARPERHPWRAIALLAMVVLMGVVLVVACVNALVATTPHRTLQVRREDLQTDLPAFYPLPSLGADRSGTTYGVWVVLRATGQASAFLSRDPQIACAVAWRGELQVEGQKGVFREPCEGATYARDGSVVTGDRPRGLDRYPAAVDEKQVTVDLEQVILGPCRNADATAECSRPGTPVSRSEQPRPASTAAR